MNLTTQNRIGKAVIFAVSAVIIVAGFLVGAA